MKFAPNFGRLFTLGTRQRLTTQVRLRVILSNQIALILLLIVVVGACMNLEPEDSAMFVGLLLLGIVAITVPVLNSLGRSTGSRLILVLLPPLLLIAPLVLTGAGHVDHLMVLPYALLTMSLLPLILFHPSSEALQQRMGIGFIGVILFVHDWLLSPSLPGEAQHWRETGLVEVKLGAVILWALIIASVRFLNRANEA